MRISHQGISRLFLGGRSLLTPLASRSYSFKVRRVWNMSGSPAAAAPAAPATASAPPRQANQGTAAAGAAPRQQGKRPFKQNGGGQQKHNKKMRKRERDMKSGSHEEILALDIKALLDEDASAAAEEPPLPEQGSHIDVEVVELSSTGDGLAQLKGSKQVYVVPFSVPGDVVKVKAYRHMQEGYTIADFISIVKPSPLRDDSRISCKYFATCSGCQFQMLDYAEQLRLKRRILIPTIQDTIGSPLQYGYRTKLTPHFDGPSGWSRGKNPFTSRPPIGYMPKGSRKTIDIEDCPIGTDAVRVGMKKERERMETEFGKYTRGSTILLRESTKRIPKDAAAAAAPESESSSIPSDAVVVESDRHTDYKTCVTDNKGMSTEYIDDFVFHNPAGSFFQNNNSILPPSPTTSASTSSPSPTPTLPPYLVDAYSGSGLFTITLSSQFKQSVGIDIAEQSIEYARKNATANRLPDSQAKFIAADANELFQSLGSYPPDETVVMLDPPRKGCDANFINQLLRFGPKRVVYVSCNVHTQARDVGHLVRGETGEAGQEVVGGKKGGKKVRYDIESLIGFDFFPQTGHVEGWRC
ncbi:tRNA (uracil-5-)-methyltransferase [Apiospora hydei]|uniref:tRNA (Uracil-5-)-methyltransferase n=1 Tax=Apiospora hydei TaxID=1337664 RepID=A0ABR1XEB0_9PEZI